MEEENVKKPKKGMTLICFIAIGLALALLVLIGLGLILGSRFLLLF